MNRLWVNCEHKRSYDNFIPCEQESRNYLAEDYSATMDWCDYNSNYAAINSFHTEIPIKINESFHKMNKPIRNNLRIAFFFTVFTDSDMFLRLLSRLYSSDHYYLIHIDNKNTNIIFENNINNYILNNNYNNIFIIKEISIIYGTSTATEVVMQAMSWYLKHASNWNYFIALTGSDYPLLPLNKIEEILSHQTPAMPFLMSWTKDTWKSIDQLTKQYKIYNDNYDLSQSLIRIQAERENHMSKRMRNYGPPLHCNNISSYYNLDNRHNYQEKSIKTSISTSITNPTVNTKRINSQWLFENKKYPRKWKKSDPGTSGAYDYQSVEYIINSIEGRKYYHFFKYMLLGSEEHIFITILYNWERTREFVSTIQSQFVFNTWILGSWKANLNGNFHTHTHLLTMNEWNILNGLSLRGVMFARKFSSNNTIELLNLIDNYILFNKTTEAGNYWPGYSNFTITASATSISQYQGLLKSFASPNSNSRKRKNEV